MASEGQPLAQILARFTREGAALRAARERPRALLRLRPPLPDPARARRHLPRALQRGGHAQGPVRVRRGPAARPGREEALLPRAAGRQGALVRHARLRLSLLLLPELGHLAGASRPAAVAPAEQHRPLRSIVSAAKRAGARIVTSTYNEPLITSEWAVEVFKAAKAEGLVCSYVSNGNGTERGARVPQALGRALQGRPQGLPRPALPRARWDARARDVHDPRAPRRRASGSRS